MTPEKKVQNKIIDYLQDLEKKGYPLLFNRRDAIGFNYKKGSADLWIVYNGLHIEVEIKAPNKQQSVMQKKWEEKCKKCKILYLIVDSAEDFKKLFNEIILKIF